MHSSLPLPDRLMANQAVVALLVLHVLGTHTLRDTLASRPFLHSLWLPFAALNLSRSRPSFPQAFPLHWLSTFQSVQHGY